jgi:hypothetical protein
MITLGKYIGVTGPNGKNSFGPFSIDRRYYKDGRFPLGALMCKLDSDTDWQKCGSGATLTADAQGCLELDINDVIQADNEGEYTVTIKILRAP